MTHSLRATSVLFVGLIVMLAFVGCQDGDQNETAVSEGEWIQLFNGEDLSGWTKRGGEATYRVEDSSIVGTSVRNSENTFLITEETFGDFVLEFDVRVHDSLNSGVQIRSKVRESGRVYGPQVEIEASLEEGAESGYIYGEAMDTGWLVPEDRLTPHSIFQDGEWNHYRVRAEGPTIETWINDEKVIELTREDVYKDHQEGVIGLQVHGVGDEGPYEVRWKNIRLREIGG